MWMRRLGAGVSGVFGGLLGGTCGIGAGVFNIPILTTFFKLSQHSAHGTCSSATLLTGIIGSASFYMAGNESVDIPSAILMTATAMVSAPLSARYAQKVTGQKLLCILTGLLASTVPVVLFSRPLNPEKRKQEEIELEKKMPLVNFEGNLMLDSEVKEVKDHESVEKGNNNFAWVMRGEGKTMLTSVPNGIAIASLGALTGVLSGAFGVGGGFIMVPLISAFSGDHQLALGTSLCAMVGPSAISLRTHMKLGNVARGISLPLALGSAIGAYIGTLLAIKLTDTQQRMWFCLVMSTVSCRNLYMARKMTEWWPLR